MTFAAALLTVGVALGAGGIEVPVRQTSALQTSALRTSALRTVDASSGARFGLRWRRAIVRTGAYRKVAVSFGRPAISKRHRLVIAGTGEGKVLAYDLHSGDVAWQIDGGVPIEAVAATATLPAGGGEVVVLGTRAGTVLAVRSQTGEKVWEAAVGGCVRAVPVQVGDRLLLSTEVNQVVLLAMATGEVLWSQGRPPPGGLTVMGHATPAVDVDKGIAYGAFSDGHVVALQLADGSRVWDRLLAMRQAPFSDADAGPVLTGDRLFAASYSDGVYALNPLDGATLWTRAAASVTSLAAAGDLLLVASSDGFVLGLAQADGSVVFRTQVPHGPVSDMAVANGLVALTVGDAGLVVLNVNTGEPVQATAFGGRMGGPPVWVGDDLAVLSDVGFLYAFRFGGRGSVR